MALFNRNRFRALASAFMLSAVLAGCGGGGGDGGGMMPDGGPTVQGPPSTSGPDVVDLDGSGNTDNYDAGGGDDMITISGSVTGNVLGGADDDTVIVVSGAQVGGRLDGGAGDLDRFVWGAGLTATGVTVTGTATAPVFDLAGGSATLPDPINFEVFVLDGGTIGSYTGSDNADRLELRSGSVTGNIDAGGGNDRVTVTDGVTFGGTSTIDGGAGTGDRFVWGEGLTATTVTADVGIDDNLVFRLAGDDHDGSGNTVPEPRNFEVFVLGGGTIGAYTGIANADRLELLSGSVTGNIDAGGGNDRVTVTSGVTFGGTSTIDGGAGDMDRFLWGAGLTTIGVTVTGTATAPVFTLGEFTPSPTNFEIFVLDGGTIGSYTGRDDIADRFEYISGTLTLGGFANGGLGAGDTFSAEEATQPITAISDGRIANGIISLRGFETILLTPFDDMFLLLAETTLDTVALIDGGAGVDRFVWGAFLEADSVTVGVVSGTTTPEFQLAGTDHSTSIAGDNLVPNPRNFEVFVLDGGGIGAYTGSANADQLELLSGMVGDIIMESGNDQLTVTNNVVFTGTIDGGAGELDRFVWGAGLTTTGVTVTSTAFTLAGGDPGTDETHDGTNTVPDPSGFEFFVLDGGTIGGYTGHSTVFDRIELLSGSVTGNIALGNQIRNWIKVTDGVEFGGSSTITANVNRDASFAWGEGLTADSVTVIPASSTGNTPGVFNLAGGPHDGTNTVPNPTNFRTFVLDGGTVGSYQNGDSNNDLALVSGSITGPITFAGNNRNTVYILGDMVSDSDGDSGNGVQPALVVNSIIDDQDMEGTTDIFRLASSPTGVPGHVANIRFSSEAPVVGATLMDGSTVVLGDVHLQGFEIIRIEQGIVDGRIEGSANADDIRIFSGMVGGNIATGAGADTVEIHGNLVEDDAEDATTLAALTLGGVINGGPGMDTLILGSQTVFTTFILSRISGGDGHVANIRFSNEAPVVGAMLDLLDTPSDASDDVAVVRGDVHLQNFETITLDGGRVTGLIDVSGATAGVTFNLVSGTAGSGDITGSSQNDTFIVSGNIAATTPALDINGLIQGGGGTADEVRLVANGIVNNLNFGTLTDGDVSMRDVETITIDGGTVNGDINAITHDAPTGITFNLRSGTINSSGNPNGGIGGSLNNDTFNLYSTITINGILNGGSGEDDVLRYAGAPAGTAFAGRGGIDADTDISDDGAGASTGPVVNIERQENAPEITSLGATPPR